MLKIKNLESITSTCNLNQVYKKYLFNYSLDLASKMIRASSANATAVEAT